MVLALPGRRAPGRDAAAQPSERAARAVGADLERRGPAARRRRRLRDHQQRGDRALRRGRGAARPAGDRGSIRSTWSDLLGERGPVAARARAVRGPAEPARHGGVHRRRLQRRRGAAARGGDRRRQVVRLPGAGAGLGAGQRRAHGREHQHHQPAGAAGRQGPAAAARARWRPTDYTPTFALLKGWRNYLCLSRLQQAVASQRTLLEPEQARRAGRHRRVGRPHVRRHAERPARRPIARGVGRGQRRARPLHPAQVRRTSTAASSSGRGAARPRPTSSW